MKNRIQFYGHLVIFFFVKKLSRYTMWGDVGLNYTPYIDASKYWGGCHYSYRVLVFQKLCYRFQSYQNRLPFVRVLLRDLWVYLSVLKFGIICLTKFGKLKKILNLFALCCCVHFLVSSNFDLSGLWSSLEKNHWRLPLENIHFMRLNVIPF